MGMSTKRSSDHEQLSSLIYLKEAYDVDRYEKVDAIESKAEAAGMTPDEYLEKTHKIKQEKAAKANGMTLEAYENVTGRTRPQRSSTSCGTTSSLSGGIRRLSA